MQIGLKDLLWLMEIFYSWNAYVVMGYSCKALKIYKSHCTIECECDFIVLKLFPNTAVKNEPLMVFFY